MFFGLTVQECANVDISGAEILLEPTEKENKPSEGTLRLASDISTKMDLEKRGKYRAGLCSCIMHGTA